MLQHGDRKQQVSIYPARHIPTFRGDRKLKDKLTGAPFISMKAPDQVHYADKVRIRHLRPLSMWAHSLAVVGDILQTHRTLMAWK